MKLASFHDTDANGKTRTIEWYKTKGQICQRIKKGNRTQFDIFYSKSSFNQIFDDIIDIQRKYMDITQKNNEKLNELVLDSIKNNKKVNLDINQLDKKTRLEMFKELIDSFSNKQFKQFNKDMEINASQHEKLCRLVGKIPPHERQGKRNYEEILQLIYSNFSDNYFYRREFKKKYDRKYNDGRDRQWISRLKKRNYINAEELTDEEREKNNLSKRVNYKYKLSNKAMRLNYKYGGFTSKKNPNWREKAMYKEAGKA